MRSPNNNGWFSPAFEMYQLLKSTFYSTQTAAEQNRRCFHTAPFWAPPVFNWIHLTTSRRTILNIYKCVCVKSLNQHKLWIFMKAGRQCIIYHDTHTPHWILKSITCHNCYMLNGAIHIAGEKTFLFFLPLFTALNICREFTFTPVGIALHFVFLQFCCTLCHDTEPLSAAVTYGDNVHNI